MNYFVTGTDTDVGKTYFTTLLITALRAAGHDAVGMKPIACGSNEDSGLILRASGKDVSLADLNPVYFETPVSPLAASQLEDREISVDSILESYGRLKEAHEIVIVEGAGGWQAPILKDYTMGDLAKSMGCRVIVVVENKLGALSHTLLTLESIRRFDLECAGIVFNHKGSSNDIASQTNRSVLESIITVPILFELEPDQSKLTDVSALV